MRRVDSSAVLLFLSIAAYLTLPHRSFLDTLSNLLPLDTLYVYEYFPFLSITIPILSLHLILLVLQNGVYSTSSPSLATPLKCPAVLLKLSNNTSDLHGICAKIDSTIYTLLEFTQGLFLSLAYDVQIIIWSATCLHCTRRTISRSKTLFIYLSGLSPFLPLQFYLSLLALSPG